MAIGDLYDANNVVVGQAAVLFAPEGTPLPDITGWNTADPFDITFWNQTPDLWVPCGATDQGWSFGASKNTQTINIEEQSTPVGTTITDQSVTISGALSEDVTQTLALALNATSAATAAAAGSPGYDKLSLQDAPINYAVGMVTVNAEGFGRLIYAPKWTQLNNVTVAFRRASDKRNHEVQFSTVCKTSEIDIRNFTAAAI